MEFHGVIKRNHAVRRRIPSTMMLLAFEAAFRSLSFTQAGRELNLTQSAISHQINALEAFLGARLFERSRGGLSLTPAGQRFAARVLPAMETLEAGVLEAMAGPEPTGSVQLAVVPTLASKWLIPRLGDFSRRHPDVTINLVTRLVPFDFDGSGLDAAIHFGAPDWPGAQCDFLMGESTVVVCSPALAQNQLRTPDDLQHLTLLHQTTRPYAWADWAHGAGIALRGAIQGPKFELFSMVAQAAAAGLGAAVLPELLIRDELAAGTLVCPFGPAVPSPLAYYLVCPQEREASLALQVFRNWLLEMARQPDAVQSEARAG